MLITQENIQSMEQEISSAKVKPDRSIPNLTKIWIFDEFDEI